MTAAQKIDALLTRPTAVAPFPLVRTAGPLSLDDARLLAALTEQRNDLEALLQDQPYWDGYRSRSGHSPALDHRVSLRSQSDSLSQRIYQLQNPGAPTLQEQGRAYVAAKKAEQAAKKGSSYLSLLGGLIGVSVAYIGLLAGIAGGMTLLINAYESNVRPPAVEVYR